MNYLCELKNGQQLRVENEGEQTHVGFGSSGPGQRQRQSTGFSTGKWSKDPEVYQVGDDVVLKVYTDSGERFVRGSQDGVRVLDQEPDLSGATKLELRESNEESDFTPMKPMEPMKPMAPMRPMKWN